MQPLGAPVASPVAVYANAAHSPSSLSPSGVYMNVADKYGLVDDDIDQHAEADRRKGSLPLALAKTSEPLRVLQVDDANTQPDAAPHDTSSRTTTLVGQPPRHYEPPSQRSAVIRFSESLWLAALLRFGDEMAAHVTRWAERNPMPTLGCVVCGSTDTKRPVRFD